MSMLVFIDQSRVWDLSYGLGKMFIQQARALESSTSLVSGVGDIANDECRIDGELFSKFLDQLLSIHVGGHAPVQNLVGGFVRIGLVLARRAELDIPSFRGQAADTWSAQLDELSLGMPD